MLFAERRRQPSHRTAQEGLGPVRLPLLSAQEAKVGHRLQCVGMLRPVTHIPDLHLDFRFLYLLSKIRQAGIISIPSHQTTKEPQVRTL